MPPPSFRNLPLLALAGFALAWLSPAEPPSAFKAYLDDEKAAAYPMVWLKARAEQIRAERQNTEKARRIVFRDYMTAERFAADPEGAVLTQQLGIRRLEQRLALQSGEVEKLRRERARAAKESAARQEELAKKIEELTKKLDDQARELQTQKSDFEKTLADLKAGVEDRFGKSRRLDRAQQRDLDLLVERGMRDFDVATFDGIEFVWIPGGAFKMGTSDSDAELLRSLKTWSPSFAAEQPVHEVEISKPFLVSRFEITQKQWQSTLPENPSAFKGENLPVDSVNWSALTKFIEKLQSLTGGTYRLPTEAEWEYCARAGGEGLFGCGKDKKPLTTDILPDYAWLAGNSENKTHPVGEKAPNAWGLYDFHGNVLEWCQDWFDPEFYSTSPKADPIEQGPGHTERVVRGGNWGVESVHARSGYRSGSLPETKSQYIGLRLVRVPAPR